MVTRAEQRERTRRTLVAESRRLFAAKGYAAVGLAEIVRESGVTKGALYHHFEGKADLFRAVLDEVQQEVAGRVVAAAEAAGDPWARFKDGCAAFVTASADPEIQRIMLIDGPAVLGWNDWRAMDEGASAKHLAEALTDLVESGTIPDQPIAPLTHLLSGAMNEAALWLAQTAAPGDLTATLAALSRLLESLRAP
ncbi:TetR/AcrR family transcriptional regulator [Nonomuraea cavernae]|uniref:TetR family transcriptional regulator n=1 Tax=Nonomuraea cavernae TaxID=2045107 RepID=A0A917YS73_9ACTN|nr:TetR/AcrR family transcriptional regulator [Nonomuraea cavernae]MCA2184146.1 TetR/AcrR family transcriptional regulator [Nonomuraea cavernae]GGO62446.1 TetR family transcriptional regulator [Nonomuraea cavernae]